MIVQYQQALAIFPQGGSDQELVELGHFTICIKLSPEAKGSIYLLKTVTS